MVPATRKVRAGRPAGKYHSKRLSSRSSAKYCEEGSPRAPHVREIRFFVNVFSACRLSLQEGSPYRARHKK